MPSEKVVSVIIKGYRPRNTGIFQPYTIPPSGECSTFDCPNQAFGSGVMGYLCDVCLRRHGLNELALRIDGMAYTLRELETKLAEAEATMASDRRLAHLTERMERLESSLIGKGKEIARLLEKLSSKKGG